MDGSYATPRVSAGVLFLDDSGRVLLVQSPYKSYWDLPGGYVEPGESPRQAAIREVMEELGLQIEVGRVLSVDWAPRDGEGDKIVFTFAGATLTAEQHSSIRYVDGEVTQTRYFDVDEIDQFTIPRLIRRIRATMPASRDGGFAYLEHGEPAGQP